MVLSVFAVFAAERYAKQVFVNIINCNNLVFTNIFFVFVSMFGNILLSLQPNNNKSLKYGRTDWLSYYYFPA